MFNEVAGLKGGKVGPGVEDEGGKEKGKSWCTWRGGGTRDTSRELEYDDRGICLSAGVKRWWWKDRGEEGEILKNCEPL